MDLRSEKAAVNLVLLIGLGTFSTFGVIYFGITTITKFL